jgi:hypothetical protein
VESSVNLAVLLKQPFLNKTFIKQVAYYANDCYVFEPQYAEAIQNKQANQNKQAIPSLQRQYAFKKINTNKAKVIIVAKAHYSQTWHSYAAVSKKELQQILTLQKSNENTATTLFQVSNDPAIDGFQVKKTTFDNDLISKLGEQRVFIPETELIAPQDTLNNNLHNDQAWLGEVDTPAGALFVSAFAGKHVNAYARGLIPTIEAFKLSSGLPSECNAFSVSRENYPTFLYHCLTHKNIELLYRSLSFNVKAWFSAKDLHLLYWSPLLAATLFYVASNTYLWFETYNVKTSLAEQQGEISALLKEKQQQDTQHQLLGLLNNEFSTTSSVHNHWSVIYDLVENGMTIQRLTFAEKLLTIRGKAPNASQVLASISKVANVSSASFKGSVVKARGQESFTLELIMKKRVSADNINDIETREKPEIQENAENPGNDMFANQNPLKSSVAVKEKA